MLVFLLAIFSFSKTFAQIMAEREVETARKFYDHDLTKVNNDLAQTLRLYKEKPNGGETEWLSHVSGLKKLNLLSLPGTHETCARVGGPAVECQSWDLYTQLDNGVRIIDIRCRHINDCFMIHHDMVYQELSFGTGVRDVCVNFLAAHPTEFIFMMIKEEYNSAECSRSFEDTFRWYLPGFENYFYLTEDMPTLDQVRGKIVVLRRFSAYGEPCGNYLSFKDNQIFTSYSTITARIQDCYKVATLFDRDGKWKKVLSILDEARNGYPQNQLFINYASGASAWCYPYSTTEYVTPKVGNYLKSSQPNAFTGAIMFDYINAHFNGLIYYLVIRNYDY